MHLTLHLTARCNLRCTYCYAAPHAGGDMTFDTARKAIELALADTRRMAPGQSLGIIFFGGEPLIMRGLIEEIVRYCAGIEAETGQLFHYKMTTNGLLLDESFLTDPLTKEIFIAMSHDGSAAVHDAHRVDAAGHGSFARLEATIDLLLRYKPYAPVMMVVNPDTVPSYAESVRYLYQRGFKYLISTLNYATMWTEKDFRALGAQYRKLADWYVRETAAEAKFYYSPFDVKIASHIFPGSCKAERCELGMKQISVAPNGRLYPCVQFVGDGTDLQYAIGHVDTGLDLAARAGLFTLNDHEKTECADCAVRERCNHYCGCLNKQTTGRVDRVSPILCAHERTIIPIADQVAARLFKQRSPLFIQKHYNELYPLISLVEDRSGGCPEAELH